MAQQPLVGQDLFITEASPSPSNTPHSIGLLWTSDQPGRGDLYLTSHNTEKRYTTIPTTGLQPAVPARERPQTPASQQISNDSTTNLINLCIWVLGVCIVIRCITVQTSKTMFLFN